MFYEERVIAGVLHYKIGPNGEWKKRTYGALQDEVVDLLGKLEHKTAYQDHRILATQYALDLANAKLQRTKEKLRKQKTLTARLYHALMITGESDVHPKP
jgi:uncharacterized membrane protein YgaE (UPF0421/DUF939 family)